MVVLEAKVDVVEDVIPEEAVATSIAKAFATSVAQVVGLVS